MYNDIAANAEQFAKSLNEFSQQVSLDFYTILRKALFDLLQEIIKKTPVDTGRARNSWVLDIEFSDFALPPGDYRSVFENVIPETMSWLPESDHYVLFNNLEYIQALENGHSQQAPSGFVAQALAAFSTYYSKAARQLGYKANS